MSAPPTSQHPRTAAELRRAFLDFFVARGHTEVPSSPLVPGDPTLLFTTAGMVQFKPYYTAADVPYTRATSVQKCLRLTDVDNVGLTPRHDTFFEMLGNFSFGPKERGAYFKEDAIAFAWEFVTGVLGLPRERLYVSIFEGEKGLPRDDEAAALWKKMGLAADHLVALGRADNFWGPAGGQGACGPCSEIYFDLGEKRPDYLAKDAFWGERPGDPGDRYMEFWNLVFPQFDAQPDGALQPLPRPGIDTGMGIERLALIVQGRSTIFETDLFQPIIDALLGIESGVAERVRQSPTVCTRDARVIADHARALSFAIAEGVRPGNTGAPYVLRRLLRRAVARGRSAEGLGLTGSFLARCGDVIVREFGRHYPELEERKKDVHDVIRDEEMAFAETYEAGFLQLEKMLGRGGKGLTGEEAFTLHDTYGFPIELTEEIVRARGQSVDRAGFETAMEEQRQRARLASKFRRADDAAHAAWTEVTTGPDSRFLGYELLDAENLTLRLWRAGGDDELELVLDQTPCYPEGGGQVADRGRLDGGGAVGELVDVFREDEHIVHRVAVRGGNHSELIAAGAAGKLAAHVEPSHRLPTMRHHTATHLLHAALRHVLGTHVKQAGSLVAPDRLRFDYSHFEAPKPEQLETIERRVNEWILRNRDVRWEVMPIDQAKALGAMALFGEKYGADVRMVSVAGVEEEGIAPSRELCGGTHVTRTGDIGAFVVVGESAIASGVRRVEALTGLVALDHLKHERATLGRAASVLQATPEAVPEQIEKLKSELDKLRKAQAEAQRGGLEAEMLALAGKAEAAASGKWVVAELQAPGDANAARDAADKLRGQLGRGAALLAIRGDGKLMFLAVVTDDLISEKRLRADELVRAVAQVAGGSGGGKPHLALAGVKDPTKLGDALAEARRLLAAALDRP